jgi:hemerythrin
MAQAPSSPRTEHEFIRALTKISQGFLKDPLSEQARQKQPAFTSRKAEIASVVWLDPYDGMTQSLYRLQRHMPTACPPAPAGCMEGVLLLKPLPWNEKYAVGVEDVDLQHRYFLNLINRIQADFTTITDAGFRQQLLLELRKYADFHFLSEENLALRRGCSGLNGHHERHSELLAELASRADAIANNRQSDEEFFLFLTNWFAGHTYYEDRILFGVQQREA